MLGRIFDYLYYVIHTHISKKYEPFTRIRATSFLSLMFFVNIMTLFCLFKEQLSEIGFYIFFGLGILIAFYSLKYFNERRAKVIFRECESKKVKKVWKLLADFYPELSLLMLIIACGGDMETILMSLGILIIYRIVIFFSQM